MKYVEEHKTEYELNKLREKLRKIAEYCKTENLATYTGDRFYYTHAKNILKIIEVD